MGALSAYAGTLAQKFLAGQNPTPPAVLFAALGNVPAGSFVELAGSDYARQGMGVTVSTAGVMSNAGGLTFGPNTALAWGPVSAIAIYDAQTGGNLIWSGLLDAPATVGLGDSVTILAGALTTAQAASS